MITYYVSQSTGLNTPIRSGSILGKGAFGTTSQLLNQNGTANGFVCKVVQIQANPEMEMTERDVLRKTVNEIHALEKMDLLEGYARKGATFYIIMKNAGGQTLANQDSFQRKFNALRDCHRQDITHFDTHVGNFREDKTGKITIIDFGFSRDATLFNIMLDSFLFLKDKLTFRNWSATLTNTFVILKLFILDYITYLRENKIAAITTFAWWGAVIFGAVHGIPTLMIPPYYFQEFLKVKIFHQVFLEIRSLSLIKKNFLAFFLSHFVNNNFLRWIYNSPLGIILKHFLKLFYVLGLYIPYTQFKKFYESYANLINDIFQIVSKGLQFTKDNIAGFFATTPTNVCFQAALLYYPLKESLKFIDDTLVNPFEPQKITKIRADLYFHYHPKLYLKAAASTMCNAVEPVVNYIRPRASPISNTDILISAIASKNILDATDIILNMSLEELNKTDANNSTPLYMALKKSRKIAELIINKFLVSDMSVPMHYQLPDGKSMFKDSVYAKKILQVVNAPYKNYACSDAKRFPGNINPAANIQAIIDRITKDSRAETEANVIQPISKGKFTRASIARCAQLIDKAQSGACTTLALASADKLLKLFPSERIEIMAYRGGILAHVFVVINHRGEGWMMNKCFTEGNSLKKGELKNLMACALDELKDAFIIDPWLATLGWDDGVFNIHDYYTNEKNRHFLTSCVNHFDSQEIAEPKIRLAM